MQVTAIYPGTFDPITNGHIDLVKRAARIFTKIIVAVAIENNKAPAFYCDERLDFAKRILAPVKNVEVCAFDGLLVEFAKKKQAQVIIRGLRAVSDFEYEFQMADINRKLAPELETVFLTPGEQFGSVSSSMVRWIASLGGDVSKFVDPIVNAALKKLKQS